MHVRQSGFSLAELLLALLILGMIATYTIPKVLQAQANSQRKAVFKETVSALSGTFYLGLQQGMISESNFGTYMTTNINTVKKCTNSVVQGCWNTTTTPLPGSETQVGIIMHNGAMIAGLDDAVIGGGYDMIMIDWNGLAGPNLEGDDIIAMIAVINNTSTSDRVGGIRGENYLPLSKALWSEIFQ